jgi:hypothetical protein
MRALTFAIFWVCLAGAHAQSTIPSDVEKDIGPQEVASAISRGRTLLLEMQETLDKAEVKAEWPYEGVYRYRGDIPIGYRVGGTAICATALIESTESGSGQSVDQAIARSTKFVLEALKLPLMSAGFEGGYDVRGWGHAYALEFLLALVRTGRTASDTATVHLTTQTLIDTLQRTEIKKRGGWNYARGPNADDASPSTFMTAPTLQFLFEAKRQGFKVDDKVIARALDALESARLDTGAFQYKSQKANQTGEGFEDVRGSIGRSPVCESTLYLAGRGSQARIQAAIDLFFEHWEWLEKRRKQTGTHVAPYMIAPYYFFYAHRYAAQAIELLPAEQRPAYRQKLYRLLWKVREESGGWNDRVFPRSENFGTAMTMLSLGEPARVSPARWTQD